MTKTTLTAFGLLTLLAGTALAAPLPNEVGVTGMGGGVYFNPSVASQQAQPQAQQRSEIGTTGEGGSVYQVPANALRG
jgi:hypothetical protein